ncbi:MAG: leucyl aminopeptidase family protein [Pseudomonadota bacterium]|nr:leucyl aminopeptidase family protein [Pseudomonadota bacterium]
MTEISTLYTDVRESAVPIETVSKNQFEAWLAAQSGLKAAWITSAGFEGEAGKVCLIPGEDGGLAGVAAGVPDNSGMWDLGSLREKLPAGDYRLQSAENSEASAHDRVAFGEDVALAWGLGAYRFNRYKGDTKPDSGTRLTWPEGCRAERIVNWVESITLTRDLINTPAGDMGPAEMAAAASAMAEKHGAEISLITGDELLEANYPSVYAVGRASDNPPCLIDITWGEPDHPKVSLVGKGVCFDTGGLDIKSADGMKLMKKDMGGGANMLGLGNMIMASNVPVRLRVLVPAVENAISGNALYPLDVITSRSGKTIEIGNTDAEGRVILADVLYEAGGEDPALLIDFATLTGAARVALGPDLPGFFCNDDILATELIAAAKVADDPLWRLPLWQPYRKLVDGATADLTNAPEGRFGGAITAALFLQEFIGDTKSWAHVDLMGWNTTDKPGRPKGGEAMGIRAVFNVIEDRFDS